MICIKWCGERLMNCGLYGKHHCRAAPLAQDGGFVSSISFAVWAITSPPAHFAVLGHRRKRAQLHSWPLQTCTTRCRTTSSFHRNLRSPETDRTPTIGRWTEKGVWLKWDWKAQIWDWKDWLNDQGKQNAKSKTTGGEAPLQEDCNWLPRYIMEIACWI